MSDAFPALPAIPGFAIARLPRIEFGSGALARLPDISAGYGHNLLLVTGLRSLDESGAGKRLFAQLAQRGLSWEQVRVSGEPSPEWIDATVAAWRRILIAAALIVLAGDANVEMIIVAPHRAHLR